MKNIFYGYLLLLCLPLYGQDSLSRYFLERELKLPSWDAAISYRPTLLLIEQTGPLPSSVRMPVITAATKALLANRGHQTQTYEGSPRAEWEQSKIAPSVAVADKWIIELHTRLLSTPPAKKYQTELVVTFIQYDFKEQVAIPVNRFTARQFFEGLSSAEWEDTIISQTRSLLLNVPKPRKQTGFAQGKRVHARHSQEIEVVWKDPDSRRNHFQLGISAGSPALVNAMLSYWGGYSFPLMVALSGMYYNREHRGLEFDAGWIIDGSGSLRQVVLFSLQGISQSEVSTGSETDALGRVATTTTSSTYSLTPYGGIGYRLQWENWHGAVGYSRKLNQFAGRPDRFWGQIGYTFSLGGGR